MNLKILLSLLAVVIVILIGREVWRVNNDDFKIATYDEEGITLQLISKERKLISIQLIDKNTNVWIPRGLGWYGAGRVGRLLGQENKKSLLGELLFYNFGFVPDVIVEGGLENWKSDWHVIAQWGVANYILFRSEEYFIGDFSGEAGLADSRLLQNDLRISLYNSSEYSGLASFVSNKLELAGFTVVGVDNFEGKVGKCLIKYEKIDSDDYGWLIIKRLFNDCRFEQNKDLAEGEVEMYLGEEFVQMINYEGYKTSITY